MPNPTDQELIDRIQVEQDRNAFAELVRRHQSPIRGLLRKLSQGDEMLADDLAQETFIRAFKAIDRFQGKAKFSTWLYRIAYNQFISFTRKKRDLTSFEDTPVDLPVAPNTDKISLKHDLKAAMNYLSPAEQTCIHLCYQIGMSRDEAAETLEMPVGTVKTHIMRGKNKLRDRLEAWAPGSGRYQIS